MEKLIGRENYQTWRLGMQAYLEQEELWEAVKGTEEDEARIKIAMLTITLAVDPEVYEHFQNCKSAKEVWDNLAKVFDDTELTRRIGLLQKLLTTNLENSSVDQYVNTIVSTAHELNGIGLNIDDEWIGSILLAGLPEEYEPMVMSLGSSGIKVSTKLVKKKIFQEVKFENCKISKNSSVAMIVKKKRKFSSSQNQSVRRLKKCFKCKETGHEVRNCPKKTKKSKNQSVLLTRNSNSDTRCSDSEAASVCAGNTCWTKIPKLSEGAVKLTRNFKNPEKRIKRPAKKVVKLDFDCSKSVISNEVGDVKDSSENIMVVDDHKALGRIRKSSYTKGAVWRNSENEFSSLVKSSKSGEILRSPIEDLWIKRIKRQCKSLNEKIKRLAVQLKKLRLLEQGL